MPYGFEGWTLVLIASVSDLCILFTFHILLLVLYVSYSGSITSVGEERANFFCHSLLVTIWISSCVGGVGVRPWLGSHSASLLQIFPGKFTKADMSNIISNFAVI